MAYDATLTFNRQAVLRPQTAVADRRDDFRRLERLVILTGGASAGAAAGFMAAIAFGPLDLRIVLLGAAPMVALALYLVARTLEEGMRRHAVGCTTAAIMHAAALLAWPMTSLFAPLSAMSFWIAPIAALSTLVLFASCWTGPSRAIYRLGGQAAIVAALAVHQGMLLTLGG